MYICVRICLCEGVYVCVYPYTRASLSFKTYGFPKPKQGSATPPAPFRETHTPAHSEFPRNHTEERAKAREPRKDTYNI